MELDRARAAVAGMRAAQSLDAFEERWKEFLHHLERTWNKTTAHFRKSPKWNGWQSKYEHLRRADPLLSYLVHARNADEHTVTEIVEREAGGIGVNPAEGEGLYIERMEIGGGRVAIQSPQRLKIDFRPARTRLVTAVDRGHTYAVPTSHLGQPLDAANIVGAAELAVGFYADALAEAERSSSNDPWPVSRGRYLSVFFYNHSMDKRLITVVAASAALNLPAPP
jgi:hypothetical protein